MQPTISYLVCSTLRSGSTFLCDGLSRIGLAGRPTEYFYSGNEPAWHILSGVALDAPYPEYVDAIIERATTPNGVFGAKIMWDAAKRFEEQMGQQPTYAGAKLPELLPRVFPNLRHISITRRDKVRQAVSWWKAEQSQQWYVREVDSAHPNKGLRFDFAYIEGYVRYLEACEADWERYFAESGVEPLRVTYEDMMAAYQGTITRILDYVGVPVPRDTVFPHPHLRRQADALSEQWVEWYYQMKSDQSELAR